MTYKGKRYHNMSIGKLLADMSINGDGVKFWTCPSFIYGEFTVSINTIPETLGRGKTTWAALCDAIKNAGLE